MEIRIEVLSTAEAEIASRAVIEIAELRESAMAAYVAQAQHGQSAEAPSISPAADAIEATAAVIEAASTAAVPKTVTATVVTSSDAVTAMQAATTRGVSLPTIVAFLGQHSAKKVTELPAEVLPAFITYLEDKTAEVLANGSV